jgi:two-component system KDP operon response regulator KdpE
VEVIKKIRSWSEVPIIVISARSEDSDKVVALDIGADDYITKPFSIEEFLARLRVALRKRDLSSDEESIFVDGELVIDYSAGIARLSGKELQLTGTEYRLLCLLAQNVGKVLTHNYILKKIWNSSSNKDRESLRVFMRNLRKKIEDDPSNPRYIQTQVGVGYRMLQR